jgi:hypothetical protein
MTERLTIAGASAPGASSETTRPTRTLLTFGVLAGPLFTLVALVQVLTRDGFDLSRHPLSLLSLGDLGWIQITNFVVSGLLAVGFAVGLRRVLRGGRGATWGPRLLALYGVGLVAGGVFVADPALGFPPGTPDGIPDQFSWHAILHAIAPPLAFLSLIVACFMFVRRFAGFGQRGWAAYSAATSVACLALGAWPGQDGLSVRLAIAQVIAWAWVFVLAAWLLTDPAAMTAPVNAELQDSAAKTARPGPGPR